MRKPHKHAEIIKAWADGIPVQVHRDGRWVDIHSPHAIVGIAPVWNPSMDYRIKPEEPETPPAPLTVQVKETDDGYGVYQGYPGDFMWVADFAARDAALDYANYLCIKYAAQLCDET